MNVQRMGAITLRHFYLMRGSVSRVLPLFVWVAVDMVLWGFISKYLNSVTQGHNFTPVFLGAVLLWDFFARVMQGVTTAFFEDVWSRNFLNIFASPLSVTEYLGGLVLSSLVTSSVGLIIMLLLATSVFGLSFFVYGILLGPFLLTLFLFGISLGIFASAIVLRFGPAAEWFIWPIPALLSPFAGVFYPLSILPDWMRFIGRLLPPAYVFEGMRTILAGGEAAWVPLLWATGLATVYIGLAYRFFLATYKHAVRSGLIARYSAETLS